MINKGLVTLGFLIVLLSVVFSSFYFYEDDFINVVSGNLVREKLVDFYESSSANDKILVSIQFISGILVIFGILLVIKKFRKGRRFSKEGFARKNVGRSRTDLDTLYEILKRKKEVRMSDVERTFEIDSDVAFGWAKILENGDLAIIDYPRFGKPILRLVEKNDIEEGVKKDEEKKQAVNAKKIVMKIGKKMNIVKKKDRKAARKVSKRVVKKRARVGGVKKKVVKKIKKK